MYCFQSPFFIDGHLGGVGKLVSYHVLSVRITKHPKTVFMSYFYNYFLLSCLLLTPIASLKASNAKPIKDNEVTVAITQITRHPSLDKVYSGMVDTLNAYSLNQACHMHIVHENAQGNISLAAQIAKMFLAKNPTVTVAIGTPSAQALHKAIGNTSIPLVFASITDPMGAGLVHSLEKPGESVTGTMNTPKLKELLQLMQTLCPTAKKVGVIINPAEKNAVDLLSLLRKHASIVGLTVVEAPANSTIEVLSAAQKLVGNIDTLLLLQDNTVASALSCVLKVTQEHNIPIFATYPEAIEQGALLALAADEYEIGKQTAKIILKILNGQSPADIPVEEPNSFKIYINFQTAKSLHILIPDDLMEKI